MSPATLAPQSRYSSDAFQRAARAVIMGGSCPSGNLGDLEVAITQDRIVLGDQIRDWLLPQVGPNIHIASFQLDVLLCSRHPSGWAQALNVEDHGGVSALGLGPVRTFQGLLRQKTLHAERVVAGARSAVLIPGALICKMPSLFQFLGIYWSIRSIPGDPRCLPAQEWESTFRPATAAEVGALTIRPESNTALVEHRGVA